MADTKITSLLTPQVTTNPATDVLPIVNIADTSMASSGSTRKITVNQLLGAGGTATLASATITGDLTVRTNKLAVTSTGVGIGTASPAYPLDVNGAIQTTSGSVAGLFQWSFGASASSRSWRAWNDVSANGDFQISTSTTRTGSTYSDRYRIDVSGVHEWSNTSGLAMTLNSTGLGVGVVPYVSWPATSKALQLGASSAIEGRTNDGSRITVYSNTVWNGTNLIYQNTAPAAYYQQAVGVHSWHTNSNTPSAGNTATFTQAMTLDASGNLLVAGTSAYIRAGGRTQIVGGSVVDINTVGNNVGIAFGGASSILPCDGSSTTTDGVANFGSASKRWNTIYASTGTINTSDQNEKQDIADLGDAEKRVAGKIKSLVKKYRFKDAVASKGENARIHVGWIAQDVQNAFSSEGLDASKYGVFCSDTWEENGVQKTRLGLRYDEVIAFVVSAI